MRILTMLKWLRLTLAAIALIAASTPLHSQGQPWAGLRAGWTDLARWNRLEGRQNEMGLGLHLSGPNGTVLVSFLGRLRTDAPTRPPSEIVVQIGVGDFADPNFTRRPILVFEVDEANAETKATIDLSGALAVDSLAPGDTFKNGLASMPAARFGRMAEAVTLSGNVFGFQITFRRDQMVAVREFAKRINLSR